MTSRILYDHPLYYDILFGWDRTAEAAFYHRLFERAGVAHDDPVLEVACGTGQVARHLAALGRRVTGMDISPAMLRFLAERASANGVAVETRCADMTTFTANARYAAAFNPMSSFRLLQSDTAAEAHLGAMADALRAGGVYALDMTFSESLDEAETTTEEEWAMSRDGVTIRATNDAIYIDDAGRDIVLQWGADAHLRNYTVASFTNRIAAVPGFRVEAWYPEVTRTGDESISTFDADDPQPSASGRVIVLLRRI